MPFIFINKNVTPKELKYTVTKKEILDVVHAVNKFRHYITSYQVFIHTYHPTIKYLMNKTITNGKITRWLLLMQEFNLTALDQPGKNNQVANFLSTLHYPGDIIPISYNFLDQNLLSITAKTPWFVDVANYLSSRILLSHFTSKHKRKITRESAIYSWVNGDLFYIFPNLLIIKCVRG